MELETPAHHFSSISHIKCFNSASSSTSCCDFRSHWKYQSALATKRFLLLSYCLLHHLHFSHLSLSLRKRAQISFPAVCCLSLPLSPSPLSLSDSSHFSSPSPNCYPLTPSSMWSRHIKGANESGEPVLPTVNGWKPSAGEVEREWKKWEKFYKKQQSRGLCLQRHYQWLH